MNYVFDTMTDCIISELQSNPCFASPIVINNILMFFQTLGSIFGDADVGPRDGEELPEAWTRHGQHVEQGRLAEVLSNVRQEDSTPNDRLDVTNDFVQMWILWSLFLSPFICSFKDIYWAFANLIPQSLNTVVLNLLLVGDPQNKNWSRSAFWETLL